MGDEQTHLMLELRNFPGHALRLGRFEPGRYARKCHAFWRAWSKVGGAAGQGKRACLSEATYLGTKHSASLKRPTPPRSVGRGHPTAEQHARHGCERQSHLLAPGTAIDIPPCLRSCFDFDMHSQDLSDDPLQRLCVHSNVSPQEP